MYVDYSRPPFIDVKLPSALVIPAYLLVLLYSAVLYADFCLFRHERRLQHIVSSKQLRLIIIIYHIMIPMIIVSSYQPYNLLFAAVPWFLAVYTASLPQQKLTIKNWFNEMINITINKRINGQQDGLNEQATKLTIQARIRLRGLQKVALGLFKLAVMHVILDPLLPTYGNDALEYPWLHPFSLIYTLLYGLKAYCFLGAVDVFMGAEQAIFAWDMVDLFNSPILSESPRDFWSRRWNKVIRNLLHEHVFTVKSDETPALQTSVLRTFSEQPATSETADKHRKLRKRMPKPKATTYTPRRSTRSTTKAASNGSVGADLTNHSKEELQEQQMKKAVQAQTPLTQHNTSENNAEMRDTRVLSVWNTRRMRGFLSFVVSGFFHELIIMSTCRHITLENLMFFTLQGLAVMLELEAGFVTTATLDYKQRIPRILLQLLFMAITGRLFTGPFLRYNFFPPNFSHVKHAL